MFQSGSLNTPLSVIGWTKQSVPPLTCFQCVTECTFSVFPQGFSQSHEPNQPATRSITTLQTYKQLKIGKKNYFSQGKNYKSHEALKMTIQLKTTDKYKIIYLKTLIVYIETTYFTFIAKYAYKYCQGM